MSTTLKTIIASGTLGAGLSSAALPHLLNRTGTPLVPDVAYVNATNGNITVVVTSTTITFTNNGLTSATAVALLESWHTFERVFGTDPAAGQLTSLSPKPVVIYAGVVGAGAPVAANGSAFYGLTAGTGNPTSTDYAATVAAGAPVPFPRLGPTTGTATLLTSTTFNLPVAGTYNVEWRVHTTEPGQLQLSINDGSGFVVRFDTTVGNMNPTAGGHPIVGMALVTTVTANAILRVLNPAGNSPALTITPADGASTHANAQTLIIKRIV